MPNKGDLSVVNSNKCRWKFLLRPDIYSYCRPSKSTLRKSSGFRLLIYQAQNGKQVFACR